MFCFFDKKSTSGTLITTIKRGHKLVLDSLAIRHLFRMNIITFGIFAVFFTLVKCTPIHSDSHSSIEIIADNLPSSDSDDSDVEIVTDPPVEIITDPPVIRIPSDTEDEDMEDQQPNFLPNGVTGHEIISQTPEEIRIYVAGPRAPEREELYHHRDPEWSQPSTSTGRRGPYRGPTLRREFAHLEACLKRRRPAWLDTPPPSTSIRRNIGK